MLKRRLAVILTAGVFVSLPAAAPAQPRSSKPVRAQSAAWISTAYGQRVLRRYINEEYTVVRGSYFSNCVKTRRNRVRCDIDFRAGLYARCARGWVRNSGGYDQHQHARADLLSRRD